MHRPKQGSRVWCACKQVYVGKDTVDGVLARLAAFKASASAHEQEVAACMLHNLFDEYRFLVKYPDRELQITARLFGGLVRMGLVTVRPTH